MEKICQKHNKPLKRFEGISKKTGLSYGNWKCTAKVGDGWCDVIIWDEDEVLTKKFTQTPTGVVESESPFPTEVSTLSDVMASLGRLHAKVNKLLNETENDQAK